MEQISPIKLKLTQAGAVVEMIMEAPGEMYGKEPIAVPWRFKAKSDTI